MPGADQPGEAQDLARPHLEGDAADDCATQASNGRPRRHRARRQIGHQALTGHRAAHDCFDDPASACAAGFETADDTTVTQDGDTVCDLYHLIDVVAHEDDAHASRLQPSHHREELAYVLHRQERCRLVEDEEAWSTVLAVLPDTIGGAHDCELRPLDRRQIGDDDERVELKVVLLEELLGPGRLMPPADMPGVEPLVVARDQVLKHRRLRKKPEVLVHEGQAVGLAPPDRHRQRRLTSVDPELACIGRVEPRQDLDQRRFAGAVFAEKAMDLTGGHLQVHAIERVRSAERLREPRDGQPRRGSLGH